MISIQQLSQNVGIGPDTLRVWERRYGFPVPERNRRGHRIYSSAQVDALRVVKKLQDLGQRPGNIFALNPNQRQALLQTLVQELTPDSEPLKRLAIETPVVELAPELRQMLETQGLVEFIHETAVPLLQILGLGWTDGSISIAREHYISDLLEDILTQEMKRYLPHPLSPRILFLTLSGERHRLGLLMAAAIFQKQGIDSLLINEDLPPHEVPELAKDLKVNGVAVSFSQHFPATQAKIDLVALRSLLDPELKLIAGGEAINHGPYLPGICVCTNLKQIPALCEKEFGIKRQ
jgi:DNA-binding transcriptional MerR regulator